VTRLEPRPPHPPERAPRRRSPLLLLLPLLFFVLALSHVLRRPQRGDPAPPPVQSDPDAGVAGWRGELSGARGWLEATLTPLHADAERQAFESRALAGRLGLEPGQAWRLRVLWSAPEAERGAASAAPHGLDRRVEGGRGAAESLARAEPAGLGLGAVEVQDGQGVALRSLPAPAPGGGAADPLRALVAPPPGSLRPGQAADWILWGRAPLEGARLAGLVPEDDALFRAATGFSAPFELRAVSLRRGDLQEPLARLERPAAPPRKSGAAPSSDGSPPDDER
jgi:hypothetical protein